MPQHPARRLARFLSGRVILPEGVEHRRWYHVRNGRRRDDDRPGMVLLDLGTRRIHVPASCLEFRVEQPRAVRRWSPKFVLAASLVPLSVAAIVAVSALSVEAR